MHGLKAELLMVSDGNQVSYIKKQKLFLTFIISICRDQCI